MPQLNRSDIQRDSTWGSDACYGDPQGGGAQGATR